MIKYWVEVCLSILLFYFGIQCIDLYRQENQIKQELEIATSLQQAISALRLETVLVDFNNTYHYDNHAQLQLKAERISQNLLLHKDIQKQLKIFNQTTSDYMQLATMLKTSRRFITSANNVFENAPADSKKFGEALLAKLSEFIVQPNSLTAIHIKQFISKNEGTLEKTNHHSFQWPMFEKHVEFLLENSLPAYQLLNDIQNLPISTVLSNNITRINNHVLSISHKLGFHIVLLVCTFFSILIIALTRQAKQLKIKSDMAEKASEVKTQFLANMSHEIRTPMNGILGLSDLCLSTELNDIQRHYIEKLKFSAMSLMTIINDILDFSKMESNKLQIENIEFDIYDVLSHVKIMLGKSAAEKNLEFIYNIDTDLPKQIIGDPIRLGQILTNLLSNAIKFTEEGYIMLSVNCIWEEGNFEGVEFSIIDTGIGLTEKQQQKLFQRFSQAEASTTRKYGGTGLGLAICKLLVDLMNGTIKVTSQVGQGSSFTVVMPYTTADDTTHTNKQSTLTDKKILLVEEHPTTIKITMNMLKHMGLQATVAKDVNKAVTIIKEEDFDYILVDWQLPDNGGHTLLKEIRELPTCSSFVFALSVYGDYEQQHQLTDIEHIKHINKPLILNELTELLISGLASPEVKQETDVTEESTQPGQSILLVEDNEINQLIALEIIKNMGFDVDLAENGLEAVSSVNEKEYDLIFMDIQMPEMDGMQATEKIREHYTDTELPIIALTANVMPDEIDHYHAIGMNDHLGKPFDRDRLEQLVRQYCP